MREGCRGASHGTSDRQDQCTGPHRGTITERVGSEVATQSRRVGRLTKAEDFTFQLFHLGNENY